MHSLSAAIARDFVTEIADLTSNDKGRQALAFSNREDEAFEWTEMKAREYLNEASLVEHRDYRVDKDAIGNLLITVYGKDQSKTVMAGSHVDSVPNGGKHDGVDGVASALAYLRSFVQSGTKETNFTLVVFRSEESSITGEACLGSKVIAGIVSETRLNAIGYGKEVQDRVLLGDHMRRRYGHSSWDEVLEERANPWVQDGSLYLPAQGQSRKGWRDMEVKAYNELHIEQSAVLIRNGYHAGIVSHIGGSMNREFTLDCCHLPSEQTETCNRARSVWTISFHGEAAHTGGTPHNTKQNREDDSSGWHRKDALIGACTFLQQALEAGLDIDVSSVTIPENTGYTTVPALQHIVIHAPHERSDSILPALQRIADKVCAAKDLECSIESGLESTRPVMTLDRKALLKHVQIPLVVEQQARQACLETQTLFGGLVRATALDASFTDAGIRMKLNVRDIDPRQRDRLAANIRRDLMERGLDVDTIFRGNPVVSEHIPLDEGIIAVGEQQAKVLGLRTLTMPSQPGHDAGSMQKAKVPSGMVYETHPGPSHIATEIVGDVEQENAITLHHLILDEYSGRRD